MDKIRKYQDIIISFLEEYAKLVPVNQPDVKALSLLIAKKITFSYCASVGKASGSYLPLFFTLISKTEKFGSNAILPSEKWWMSLWDKVSPEKISYSVSDTPKCAPTPASRYLDYPFFSHDHSIRDSG